MTTIDIQTTEDFYAWFAQLMDQWAVTRIQARIDRVESGNLGDCAPVAKGESVLDLDFAWLTHKRQVAHPAPFEPINTAASAYAGRNRRCPSITPTRNAHDSALAVVLNLLDHLPLIPHNPHGDTMAVFRDSAFENEVAKSNLAAILQQHGVGQVRSL